MLDISVERPANVETTAAGAAFLAGMAVGVWSGTDAVAASWREDRLFTPRMAASERATLAAGWRDALTRTLSK
jgi:glycerol kinase